MADRTPSWSGVRPLRRAGSGRTANSRAGRARAGASPSQHQMPEPYGPSTAWTPLLVVASGAGANAQKAIGIATFSGMLAATFIGIIFVPALYALFQRMREFVLRRR